MGARTVAQMRRGMGVGAPREKDSLYQDVGRIERIFPALKVPKNLQSNLPFATKPKLEVARKRPTLEQRRAVLMEKEEKKVLFSSLSYHSGPYQSLPCMLACCRHSRYCFRALPV